MRFSPAVFVETNLYCQSCTVAVCIIVLAGKVLCCWTIAVPGAAATRLNAPCKRVKKSKTVAHSTENRQRKRPHIGVLKRLVANAHWHHIRMEAVEGLGGATKVSSATAGPLGAGNNLPHFAVLLVLCFLEYPASTPETRVSKLRFWRTPYQRTAQSLSATGVGCEAASLALACIK